jgi:Ca2+-binding RTX toxin-like protein
MKQFLIVLAVIALLPVTPASADSLIIGSSTNRVSITYDGTDYSVGGGSFDVSTLDGTALPWMYCVDLDHYMSLSTTYPNTLVRHDGVVNGVAVDNAAKVAWLLDTYASQAAGDNKKEAALQGLIWKAIYGSSFTFSSANSSYAQYVAWLPTTFGSGDVAKYSWLTPDSRCNPATGSNCKQGQVTYEPVPDAAATAMLLGAALAGLAAFRRPR